MWLRIGKLVIMLQNGVLNSSLVLDNSKKLWQEAAYGRFTFTIIIESDPKWNSLESITYCSKICTY